MLSKNILKKPHKWSLKYKRSINCQRPRGFSQKQHCKYGRSKYGRSKYGRSKYGRSKYNKTRKIINT
jgi:hypothetical protein